MRYVLLIIAALLVVAPAKALVIDKDVVWKGDKSFAEDVRVLPGVTLTIAFGSRLYFNGGGLEVTGTLVATSVEFSGDNWNGLLIKGNDAKTKLFGCVIKNAKTGVLVQGGTPVFQKLRLIGNNVGIELRGKAGGSLSSSAFIENKKVGLFVKDGSTTAIVDCSFERNGRFGAYLYRSKPEKFVASGFFDNPVGLMIAYHGTDPVVEDTLFERNDIAIQVDRAARPIIKFNRVKENEIGLYAYRRSDPVVTGNHFEANDVGVLVAYSSYPEIDGNDFSDNQLAIKLEYQSSSWEEQRGATIRAGETAARTAFAGQGGRTVSENDRKARTLDGVVSATGNWWGKEGTAELLQSGESGNPTFIHDGRDQAAFVDAGQEYLLDRVKYHPWSQTSLTEREK